MCDSSTANWELFSTPSKLFLYKKVLTNNVCKFYLSDLVNVWIEELRMEQLLERCQKLNPVVEASPEHLFEYVQSLLSGEGKKIHKEVTEEDDYLILKLKSDLSGVLFQYEFRLKLMERKSVFEELTLPLIFMVQELQEREKVLFTQLRKKDKEIAQYKMEGAVLTRKNVETQEFKETDFKEKAQIKLSNMGTPVKAFHSIAQPLYADIRKKLSDFKESPVCNNLELDDKESIVPKKEIISLPQRSLKMEEKKGIVFDDDCDDDPSGNRPQSEVPKKKKKTKRVQLKF